MKKLFGLFGVLITIFALGACDVGETVTSPETPLLPQFSVTSSDWNSIHEDFTAGVVDAQSADGSMFEVDLWWDPAFQFGGGTPIQDAIIAQRIDAGTFLFNMEYLREYTDNSNPSESVFESNVEEIVSDLYTLVNIQWVTYKMGIGYQSGPNPWQHNSQAYQHLLDAEDDLAYASDEMYTVIQELQSYDWFGASQALRDVADLLWDARIDVIRAQYDVEQAGQGNDEMWLTTQALWKYSRDLSRSFDHIADAMYTYGSAHSSGGGGCEVNCGGGPEM